MNTQNTQSTQNQSVMKKNNTQSIINEYINLKVLIIKSLRAQKYPENFTYPMLNQINYTLKEQK